MYKVVTDIIIYPKTPDRSSDNAQCCIIILSLFEKLSNCKFGISLEFCIMVSRKRHFYVSPVFVHRQTSSHSLINNVLLQLVCIRIQVYRLITYVRACLRLKSKMVSNFDKKKK